MSALDARSVYSMDDISHDAKFSSTLEIRMAGNDARARPLYHAKMARKSAKSNGIRPEQPDWFLREWMKTLQVSQTRLAEMCDWKPSTMHGIYHGRTSYYRDILNLIATKLNVEPYELLMPPEQAMAFRRFQESAAEVVNLGERKVERSYAEPARHRKTGTDDR